MDDLISRQAAIDAINHICPVDTEYDCTLLDRVDVRCVLSDLPSAEPELEIYAKMPDAEFEKWLHDHGICNPNIHESIPCSCVPLLIDSAINDVLHTPSMEGEQNE